MRWQTYQRIDNAVLTLCVLAFIASLVLSPFALGWAFTSFGFCIALAAVHFVIQQRQDNRARDERAANTTYEE
jgi:hypothetical protein